MRIVAVIPVKNKADVLAPCLESLRTAQQRKPDTAIVVVDNGSTDGSLAIEKRYRDGFALVHSTATRVGGVRNDGARSRPEADAYAFVDCDCIVPERFFEDVERTFIERGADAVGCEVVSPSVGHWSERVWDRLHRPGGDGPRHYINSACFCISGRSFWSIGGFDDTKRSSEDVDICRRLAAAGGTMWQSERLAVIHLGNAKSIPALYRRIRWHGEGIWEPGKGVQWSVSTFATIAHPVAIFVGVVAAIAAMPRHPWAALACVTIGLVVTPAMFVVARAVQFRRRVPVFGGMALMFITFAARLAGIFRSIRTSHRSV